MELENLENISEKNSDNTLEGSNEGKNSLTQITFSSYSRFILLKFLNFADLEIYNDGHSQYEIYVFNDINHVRERFDIPPRNIDQTFILFKNKDFINEYKSFFYNENCKENLENKFKFLNFH